MTEAELKKQVKAAYGKFTDEMEKLGKRFGVSPPSVMLVEADHRTAHAARLLRREFEEAERSIHDQFHKGD